MSRGRRQHLLFTINQITRAKRGEFKSVPVRNGVGGTSFHAITAEYTSIIVDVINAGVALRARDPLLGRILRGFYVDAIRRASSGTQETGHAFFQPVLVALH